MEGMFYVGVDLHKTQFTIYNFFVDQNAYCELCFM